VFDHALPVNFAMDDRGMNRVLTILKAVLQVGIQLNIQLFNGMG
jgi:hypothetical protein